MLLLMLNQQAVDYAIESFGGLVQSSLQDRRMLRGSALVTGLEVTERRPDEPFRATVDILLRLSTAQEDHQQIVASLTEARVATALRVHTLQGFARFEPTFRLRRMTCSVNDASPIDITNPEESAHA